MDPSVVSFPGNGQILVSSINFLWRGLIDDSFVEIRRVNSVKVCLVGQAVAKQANQNCSAIMWYSNRVHRNQMCSNIQASSESLKWPSKVLAAQHFAMDKREAVKPTH